MLLRRRLTRIRRSSFGYLLGYFSIEFGSIGDVFRVYFCLWWRLVVVARYSDG